MDDIEKKIDKLSIKKKKLPIKHVSLKACLDCGVAFPKVSPVNKKRCVKCAVKHVREQKRKSRAKSKASPELKLVKKQGKPTYFEPIKETKPVAVVREALELPNTTTLSPECEMDVPNVYKHSDKYLEVNIVCKSRVVDTFYVKNSLKKFTYNKASYKINEEGIYLLPARTGVFMPTSFYKEGSENPVSFRQTNKGITGKALSLLYSEQLYMTLLHTEDKKLNFFIVILSLAVLATLIVGYYLLFMHDFGHGGGGGEVILPVIRPFLGWF